MNRRIFLLLGAAMAAGCAASPGGMNLSSSQRRRVTNAGPPSQYLADGVYTRYKDLGFFIVRHGANLLAVSSICTHRRCKLKVEPDDTFLCPCHGSTFDANGKLTQGPARIDLPVFELSTADNGDLLVKSY